MHIHKYVLFSFFISVTILSLHSAASEHSTGYSSSGDATYVKPTPAQLIYDDEVGTSTSGIEARSTGSLIQHTADDAGNGDNGGITSTSECTTSITSVAVATSGDRRSTTTDCPHQDVQQTLFLSPLENERMKLRTDAQEAINALNQWVVGLKPASFSFAIKVAELRKLLKLQLEEWKLFVSVLGGDHEQENLASKVRFLLSEDFTLHVLNRLKSIVVLLSNEQTESRSDSVEASIHWLKLISNHMSRATQFSIDFTGDDLAECEEGEFQDVLHIKDAYLHFLDVVENYVEVSLDRHVASHRNSEQSFLPRCCKYSRKAYCCKSTTSGERSVRRRTTLIIVCAMMVVAGGLYTAIKSGDLRVLFGSGTVLLLLVCLVESVRLWDYCKVADSPKTVILQKIEEFALFLKSRFREHNEATVDFQPA